MNDQKKTEMKLRVGKTAKQRSVPLIPFVTAALTLQSFNHLTAAKQ
jgi:hypothetical protein